MNSRLLKIVPLLFGLFFVSVSFGSLPNAAQAYWSTSCAGGWETQTSWTNWAYYEGGAYICASDYGCYASPDCGSDARWYSCTQSTTQTWNPNINCTQTWIPDCTTAYGSASCNQDLTQYGVPSGYTVGTAYYSYNTCTYAVTYLGYACSAPPPTTAPWLSVNPSTVTTVQTFQFSWTAANNTPTDYQRSVSMNSGAWSAWGSAGLIIAWPASPQTPAAQGWPAGTYAFQVRGCNTAGCGPASNTSTLTVNNPVVFTLLNGSYASAVSGGKYQVTKFGGDYRFGNSGGPTYFVPLNSWAEFNSFWNAISRLSGLSTIQ